MIQTPIRSRERALKWREQFYFDAAEADRVVRFFHTHVKHTVGKFAGQKFILEPWQRKLIRRLFGWKKRSDGTRKHRQLFLFVPRKNGKSTLCAGIALYLLHADGEKGAHIVSAAADAKQASIIFDTARDMNTGDPLLSSRAQSYRQSLVIYDTGSNYKVLSSVAGTKHGENLHGVLFDELHTQEDRDLYDVLKTSTASRDRSLECYITTAGYDRDSICYEVYEYAKRCLTGEVEDPSMLAAIFEADPKEDEKKYGPLWWAHEEVWRKANPNYGISINKEYFERQIIAAKQSLSFLATFLRLHLNVWTEADVGAIPMEEWRECGNLPISKDELAGSKCWLGIDLSSKDDLTALALLFYVNGIWKVLMHFWCPEETIKKLTSRGRNDYRTWAERGYLTVVPGKNIDTEIIRNLIRDVISKMYQIEEICFDPWQAHALANKLAKEDGMVTVGVRQGYQTLSEPTKEFLAIVADRKIAHGNNPILSWNASNLATESDPAGNLKPSKKRSKLKIDGCSAIITALARALLAENKESRYSSEEIQVW